MRLFSYIVAHPCSRCKRHHRVFVELSAKTFVCLACARVQVRLKDAPARERKPWRKRNLPRTERQRWFDERATQIKTARASQSDARQ
jgi:hypothetical protein